MGYHSTDESRVSSRTAALDCQGQGWSWVATCVPPCPAAGEVGRPLGDARRRKFDIVATWGLDRLTMEGPLPTLLYLHRLAALGLKV